MNTIPAQEIKRRGITAVDELLVNGPVHVITQNIPSYVVMSEERYRDLMNDARDGIVARVRESQANYDAGRYTTYANAAELMAAIDAADDESA